MSFSETLGLILASLSSGPIESPGTMPDFMMKTTGSTDKNCAENAPHTNQTTAQRPAYPPRGSQSNTMHSIETLAFSCNRAKSRRRHAILTRSHNLITAQHAQQRPLRPLPQGSAIQRVVVVCSTMLPSFVGRRRYEQDIKKLEAPPACIFVD